MVLWVTQNHFTTGECPWHQTCSSQHDIRQEHEGKASGGSAEGPLHECPRVPPQLPRETRSQAPGQGRQACALGRVVVVVMVVVVVFVVVVVLVALDHGHRVALPHQHGRQVPNHLVLYYRRLAQCGLKG